MKTVISNIFLNKNVSFILISIIILVNLYVAILFQNLLFLAPTLLLIGAYVLILDYSLLFYVILFLLPYSVSYTLNNGFTLELFSEPLMMLFTGVFLLVLLVNSKLIKTVSLSPVTYLLFLHFMFFFISSLDSVNFVRSIKYSLAKTWFIIPFFLFVGSYIGHHFYKLKGVLWIYTISITLIIFWVTAKHISVGLSFDNINVPIYPFFWNHVIYSSTIAVFLPFVFVLYFYSDNNFIKRNFLLFSLILILFATVISVTRATWLALVLTAPFYFIVNNKLTKTTLITSFSIVILGVIYLAKDNKYLDFAPDYESTVYNHGNLEKHLEATYQMKDVSGVERLNRWVAAAKMGFYNPITGTGPGTFYPEYKNYTSEQFRTYVSSNEEQSTTHNYFLLLWAEQGLVGLAIFLSLISYTFIRGEMLYHFIQDRFEKGVVLGALLSIFILLIHLFLNELIEVDKIGSWFFISLSLIAILDQKYFYSKNNEKIEISSKNG